MSNYHTLTVNIEIDVLVLTEDTTVLNTMADFSSLPYREKDGEGNIFNVNPDIPYISESVTLQPFSQPNLILPAGVHLHWKIPEGLASAPADTSIFGTGQIFPAVPNRWLVKRSDGKEWIVESDYLFPEGSQLSDWHTTVPMPSVIREGDIETVKALPFRYMGRSILKEDWLAERALKRNTKNNEYWSDYYKQPLTAVAYGEPIFARYYPNCATVFGFYDDNPVCSSSYTVTGWYEQTNGYTNDPDYYYELIKRFNNQPLVIQQQPLLDEYKRTGRLAWDALITGTKDSTKDLNPTDAMVAPDGYGSGWSKDTTVTAINNSVIECEIKAFLSPSPLVAMDFSTYFDAFVTNLWSDIIATSSYATLIDSTTVAIFITPSPTAASISTLNLPYLPAYKNNALVDFLNPAKHLTLLKYSSVSASTIGSLNSSDIWEQLVTKNWIVPITGYEGTSSTDFTGALAAIMPIRKRKPLDPEYRQYKTQIVALTTSKLTFLTQAQLKSQLTVYFNSLPAAFLFPKQRLIDRYGSSDGGVLWTLLLSNNHLYPLSDAPLSDDPLPDDYPFPHDYAFLPQSLSSNIDNIVASVTASTVSSGSQSLFKTDAKTGILFNPHTHFSTVTSTDLTNRYNSTNGPIYWKALYTNNYILPTGTNISVAPFGIMTKQQVINYYHEQALSIWKTQISNKAISPAIGVVNTTVIGNPLPIPTDFVKKINQITHTIHISDLTKEFGDEADDAIWQELIAKKWIILLPDSYTTGTINTAGQVNTLDTKVVIPANVSILKSLLNPKVKLLKNITIPIQNILYTFKKSALTAKFGLEAGSQIWTALIQQGWLTRINDIIATINNSRERKNLGKSLSNYLSDIVSLLTPQVYWKTFTDTFGLESGDVIWRMLVADNWVITNSETVTEVVMSSAINAMNGTRFVQYAYKIALLNFLKNKLNWEIQGETSIGSTSTLTWNKGKLETVETTLSSTLDKKNETYYNNIVNQIIPSRSTFYGSVSSISTTDSNTVNTTTSNIELSIGNSSPEAISAYLASKVIAQPSPPTNQKAIAEDILEGIQMAQKLENVKFDLAAKFHALHQETEFTAETGGIIWQITPIQSQNKDNPNTQQQVTLSPELATELNQLNSLQKTYEESHYEIVSLREQLYKDWYKYMLSAYPPLDDQDYPDVNDIKLFIEQFDLIPLHSKIEATGELKIIGDRDNIKGAIGHFVDLDINQWDYKQLQVIEILNEYNATLLGEDPAYRVLTQAHLVAQQIRRIMDSINAFNQTQINHPSPKHYRLSWIPGPRFWQSKDPVLFFTGDEGDFPTPTTDTKEACVVGLNHSLPITAKNLSNIGVSIHTILEKNTSFSSSFSSSFWQPMMFEWQVKHTQLSGETAIATATDKKTYNADFITTNYDLPEENPYFKIINNKGRLSSTTNSYQGFGLLTPSLITGFTNNLSSYLKNTHNIETSKPLTDQLSSIKGLTDSLKQIISVAYDASKNLPATSMAQKLSGFNAMLIQQKKTLQFKVADPLGFKSFQKFTNTVRKYIGNYNRTAPEPLFNFNPIRAGAMNISGLRLVDTFGQVQDLSSSTDVITSKQMKYVYNPANIHLPPRIMQPARLNLRWMSAEAEEMEMNNHPATAPICGWVIMNKLDNTLLIYDNQGDMIGIIESSGTDTKWMMPPGGGGIQNYNDIQNIYLKDFVTNFITNATTGYLEDFISGADNVLENIHPEYFTEHQDLALLMSRPMALVRVSMGLQVKGLLNNALDWNSFNQSLVDVKGGDIPFQTDDVASFIAHFRNTESYEKVDFPVRLGDYHRLNDGLVAYWDVTSGSSSETDWTTVYMPQTTIPNSNFSSKIKLGTSTTLETTLNINEKAKIYTMLIDPTGSLHATSGILPVKEINIPPEQYKAVLKKIKVTFMAAPILTSVNKIEVPIPHEDNYQWTWLQNNQGKWQETPMITEDNFTLGWTTTTGEAVWTVLKQSFYGKNFGSQTITQIVKTLFTMVTSTEQQVITNFLTNNKITKPDAAPVSLEYFNNLWTKSVSIQKNAQELWTYLFTVDWLKALETNAKVIPENERSTTTFAMPWIGKEEMVNNILSQYAWDFAPPKLNGAFSEPQELVDGYLKLQWKG